MYGRLAKVPVKQIVKNEKVIIEISLPQIDVYIGFGKEGLAPRDIYVHMHEK
jgi:hypothetical protein